MKQFKFQSLNAEGQMVMITSVVMDEQEFADLVQRCESTGLVYGEIQNVLAIHRGTKTEHLFRHYDIDTSLASFIIRGTGRKLVQSKSMN